MSVRLLDFGIAKMITFTHNLTRHNLGSPTYCSPERLANAQVDPQADLWALGVSLYEMVSGMPPYQAVSTRKLESLDSIAPPAARASGKLPAAIARDFVQSTGRRSSAPVCLRGGLRERPAGIPRNRHTVATEEKLPAWDANATIQKFRRRIRCAGSALKIPKPRRAKIARIARPVGVGLCLACWWPCR